MTVHWWKMRNTRFENRPLDTGSFIAAGRKKHKSELDRVTFTRNGIVFSAMVKHDERLLKSETKKLNYFTHYAMVLNGRLWRGSSWGGTMSSEGMRLRSLEFSKRVARRMPDEAIDLPVSPSTKLKREYVRTRQAMVALVDLCLAWINSSFPRSNIVWSSEDDYPSALRTAIALLEGTGGDGEEG